MVELKLQRRKMCVLNIYMASIANVYIDSCVVFLNVDLRYNALSGLHQ